MGNRPASTAHLAMLLEVAGTPKPGNVDRHRDLSDLGFEHFLAGAVGARPGLVAAATGDRVGAAFETAIAGMAAATDRNTHFGTLLLLVPLVAATDDGTIAPAATERVVEDTTIADAADFYRAFDHVEVAVGDPPADAPDLDVRRGSDAVSAVESRGLTLLDVMERSTPGDGVAREWTTGFERTFETAERIRSGDGSILDRAADAFLALLARDPDTLVQTRHGEAVAREVTDRAASLEDGSREAIEAFAADLVDRGINPGTTADVTAAGLYVALTRGASL
ncbi:MAG: triphosphoribosyl-dephospho-CoA synthase [Halanaeroarchaeum sp.]